MNMELYTTCLKLDAETRQIETVEEIAKYRLYLKKRIKLLMPLWWEEKKEDYKQSRTHILERIAGVPENNSLYIIELKKKGVF
mgnify:CR=1 FL=1